MLGSIVCNVVFSSLMLVLKQDFYGLTSHQTWGNYSTDVIDYDYLPPARFRLLINKIAM